MLHLGLIDKIFSRIKEEELMSGPGLPSLGLLEQDIACGVDTSGKDTKAASLQAKLIKLFSEPATAHLPSESKLRLLMLFFTCFANVAESLRKQLIEFAKLSADDQDVLMAMLRTKLMEVPDNHRHKLGSGCIHRVTQEQAVRFKRNARADGRFELSRFEPRIKGLIEQLSQDGLSCEDFPALDGNNTNMNGPRFAAAAPGASPQGAGGDEWSFTSWQAPVEGGAGKTSKPKEVTQRIIVFILGGITHSELRAAAEVRQTLPRGVEVILGGTAVLTPRKLMQTLRPRGGESGRAADDRLDLA